MPDDLNLREAVIEATSATTTWDVLGGVGGLAAGVSLLFLLYLQAKPLVNRWALRGFLHIAHAPTGDDLLTDEQARSLSWRRRLTRRRRALAYRAFQRLMTKVQQINSYRLIESFEAAKEQLMELWASDDLQLPHQLPERERDIILEAAGFSKLKDERVRRRRMTRAHKGVRCAAGCGTRFGKRRSDHNFSGGGGIEGGWHCASPRSCLDKPTGDHYCGMCTVERRQEAATVDGAAL